MFLLNEEWFNPIWELLESCKGVEQHPIFHPEGDVFNHSIQVFAKAQREVDNFDILLACLLHDVGKRVIGHGHEKESVKLVASLHCASNKVLWLVEHHMRFWDWVSGEMNGWKKSKYLSEHPWLGELACVCRFDGMGRAPFWTGVDKWTKEVVFERLDRAEAWRFMDIHASKI